MGLLGFAYRVATLPVSIAYTPIRLVSEVLFGSNEDALRAKMEEEKKAFEKKEKELKERAVPLYVYGHPKDMQTVCASVDMKKADAKIKAICNGEKSSPLSVEMKGGGIFSRSVPMQRVTPEVVQQKNRIGAILIPIFGEQDSKAIIDSAFDEPNSMKRAEKLKVVDAIVQSIMKPVPESLPTNVTIVIAKHFNDSLANKIIQALSPQNILELKKKRAADTLSTLRNLCSDPNLKDEEGCKILNPQRPGQGFLPSRLFYGGKRRTQKGKKAKKTKKTNTLRRKNKTNRR